MDSFTQSEKDYLNNIRDEDERKLVEARILKLRKDYEAVISTPEGRRVLWSILEHGNIYASTFSPNSWAGFNEGKRALALQLVEQIVAANPSVWVKMQQDYLNINSFKLNK